MVVRILDIVTGADTADQGQHVLGHIRAALQTGSDVVISFDGVQSATSSFVNSAFVPLLDDLSLDDIKRRVTVVRSSRQINDMIRTRLTREALAHA